jgi:hypothetical protein
MRPRFDLARGIHNLLGPWGLAKFGHDPVLLEELRGQFTLSPKSAATNSPLSSEAITCWLCKPTLNTPKRLSNHRQLR